MTSVRQIAQVLGGERSNLDVARDLANAGMFAFPAIVSWNAKEQKLNKQPAVKGWRNAATTDRKQLAKWWNDFPSAVPGIELGRSHLFVVDLDRHPGGADGVAAFKTLRGDNPIARCLTVKTPSNGFHLYFWQPDGAPLGNGRGSLPSGIDVRGDGGWTVAPGAFYKQWRWQAYRYGSPSYAPDWVVAAIRSQRIGEPRDRRWTPCGDGWLRGLVRVIANATEGERNSKLFWATCRAAERVSDGKADEAFVTDVLTEAATRAGLPEREARGTIKSGMHRQ